MRNSLTLCQRIRRVLRPSMFRQSKRQKFEPAATMNHEKKNSNKGSVTFSHGDIVVFPTPIKAQSDKKDYEVIKLSNGLMATLISDTPNIIDLSSDDESTGRSADEKTDSDSGGELTESDEEHEHVEAKEKMAACALTVEVGSFSDPDDVQGLSHFLEHMVFMGSEKYPKENEFSSFIKRHGGSDNAFTECQYTTFHFECPEKQLNKAMDIFSQFFIKPLLKWDAIDREREAIESEFQQAFPNDSYRKDQLLCSIATKDNPSRKFTWGNQYTLRDNVTDEHLQETVKKYRETHYSSDRMKLAVQARLPIPVLRKWVTEYFSQVPQLPNNAEVFKSMETPFDMEKFRRFYYVKSMKDMAEIDVRWALPPVLRKYKTKPLNYLAFIIGHEGKGSLLSLLKNKLWALGLRAGYADDGLNSNDLYSIFVISVTLTDQGRDAIGDVLTAIFSYMKMLRENAPDKRLFDETQCLAETGFRFQEESSAHDNAENISQSMLIFPTQDYLRGDELYFDYDPDEITDYLKRMTPSNVNIMYFAKDHPLPLTEEEFWFKTKYRSEPIPDKWLVNWENVEADSAFHLPEKNIFIPTDFTLIDPVNVPKYPRKITNTELVEIWYKGDDKFRLPIASVDIFVLMPKTIQSAEYLGLMEIYIKLLVHQLMEDLYHALAADLEYGIGIKECGIHIGVYGYNQNLGLLVDGIARGMKRFNEEVDENVLEAFKRFFARGYYNEILKAGSLAKQIRVGSYMEPYFTSADKFGHVKSIDLTKVKQLAETLFDDVHFQALIQGNLTAQKGQEIVNSFVQCVQPKGSLPVDKYPKHRVKVIPKGEKCFRINSFNLEDKNCVTTVYYQYGPGTIQEYVALELFIMIMEEPLFDKLRTQLQLGYDVSADVRETEGILAISATVHSQINKFSVEHVKERIDEFVNSFVETFPQIDDESFVDSQESLIKLKRNVDTYLKEESKRNFEEIRTQEFVFDRLEKEIDFISKLKKKTVADLVNKIVSSGTSDHRKLVVQVVGHKGQDDSTENEISNEIDEVDVSDHILPDKIALEFLAAPDFPENYFVTDFEEWKKALPEYPPHKLVK